MKDVMKTVVIYKSKSGFTKKYAVWIAEALAADIYPVSEIIEADLDRYDSVVYGGGLHAVGINGIKFIKRNLERIKGKRLAIFACGASPARENVLKEVCDMNFSSEEQKYLKFFYLRGGFDYSKLTFVDKILMSLMKMKLNSRKQLEPDERGMLAAYDTPVDFTRQKNIDELIKYMKS
jgi:Flavodoxin